MTTVVNTCKNVDLQDGAIQSIVWSPLTSTNLDGSPVRGAAFADRCFQVDGTFGAGATVTIQGSNDETDPPTNWYPLTKAGTAAAVMAFTTAGGAGIATANELTRWVRPLLAGGDGTTSLNVKLVARRQNPMRT
jgi:hypothetical protein